MKVWFGTKRNNLQRLREDILYALEILLGFEWISIGFALLDPVAMKLVEVL